MTDVKALKEQILVIDSKIETLNEEKRLLLDILFATQLGKKDILNFIPKPIHPVPAGKILFYEIDLEVETGRIIAIEYYLKNKYYSVREGTRHIMVSRAYDLNGKRYYIGLREQKETIGTELIDFAQTKAKSIVDKFDLDDYSLVDKDAIRCVKLRVTNEGFDYRWHFYGHSRETINLLTAQGAPIRYNNFKGVFRNHDIEYLPS